MNTKAVTSTDLKIARQYNDLDQSPDLFRSDVVYIYLYTLYAVDFLRNSMRDDEALA